MLFLTSPSKTQHIDVRFPKIDFTQPLFLDKTDELITVLKDKSLVELQETLRVSEKLAELNFERYQDWELSHTVENSNPALFTYNGDIFKKMSVLDYSADDLIYAQQTVRIISGLYGILRPLDLMQPYRLEMNTGLEIHTSRDLYSFWRAILTKYLQQEIEAGKHTHIINVASKQYSDAIAFHELTVPVVTIHFLERKDSKLQPITLYLKHARGMMLDHCIKIKAQSLGDLKSFTAGGYALESETEDTMTFVR